MGLRHGDLGCGMRMRAWGRGLRVRGFPTMVKLMVKVGFKFDGQSWRGSRRQSRGGVEV